MYGIISVVTDSSEIEYCVKCGKRIYVRHVDGIAECDSCCYRFGVVDCTDDEKAVD